MRYSIALKEHHVVPTIHRGFDVKRNGFHTAIIHTNTKATAIELGRILSKVESTGFIIHGRDQRSERHENYSYSLRAGLAK